MNGRTASRRRSFLAGGAAALIWALQEPLDERVFGCDYSDIALLGKAVTRGRGWRIAGLALHVTNGALFGVAFHEFRRLRPGSATRAGAIRLGVGLALAEHVTLYPLSYFVDRYHPARGERGIPALLNNPRAFAQATWRHALFGAALGSFAASGY